MPKYHSNFEKLLDKGPLSIAKYHPKPLYYVVPEQVCQYTPDWLYKNWYIESKGRFRTKAEATKYIHIRDSLEEGKKFIFVFQNPNTPMPGSKRRRDGTKFSVSEWADKHNFIWATIDNVMEILDEGIR